MTRDCAMRFGEYIAQNNNHFDKWCREHGYANTNIYGGFQMFIDSARKAISQYRKEYGFSKDEYSNWNVDCGWRYGYFSAKVKV